MDEQSLKRYAQTGDKEAQRILDEDGVDWGKETIEQAIIDLKDAMGMDYQSAELAVYEGLKKQARIGTPPELEKFAEMLNRPQAQHFSQPISRTKSSKGKFASNRQPPKKKRK